LTSLREEWNTKATKWGRELETTALRVTQVEVGTMREKRRGDRHIPGESLHITNKVSTSRFKGTR